MTKYTIKYTTQFKKDYKLAKRQNKDTNLLQSVVALLANGHPLPERFRDHPLGGNWKGYRECHIVPDWLLIYRYDEDVLILTMARTGSHSELFH